MRKEKIENSALQLKIKRVFYQVRNERVQLMPIECQSPEELPEIFIEQPQKKKSTRSATKNRGCKLN